MHTKQITFVLPDSMQTRIEVKVLMAKQEN